LQQKLNPAETLLGTMGSDRGIANVDTGGTETGGEFDGEKDNGDDRESGSDNWTAYGRRASLS
jgi:hypothetical protein